MCSCFVGFKGSSCDIDCGCAGHGTCANTTASSPSASSSPAPTCICDVGWRWSVADAKCVPDCATAATSGCSGAGQPVCTGCVNGFCLDGKCECWAGYEGPQCTSSVSRPNQKSKVGTNAAGIAYYSAEWVFVDVMKASSGWVSLNAPGSAVNTSNPMSGNGQWGNGQPIALRPDGYPAYLLPNQVVVRFDLPFTIPLIVNKMHSLS